MKSQRPTDGAHTRIPDADPMDGQWPRLDESAASSAQMIQWYAPETFAQIQAVAMEAAARDIDAEWGTGAALGHPDMSVARSWLLDRAESYRGDRGTRVCHNGCGTSWRPATVVTCPTCGPLTREPNPLILLAGVPDALDDL